MSTAGSTADRELSVTQTAGLVAVQFPQLADKDMNDAVRNPVWLIGTDGRTVVIGPNRAR